MNNPALIKFIIASKKDNKLAVALQIEGGCFTKVKIQLILAVEGGIMIRFMLSMIIIQMKNYVYKILTRVTAHQEECLLPFNIQIEVVA
jgi:hypothetical protein